MTEPEEVRSLLSRFESRMNVDQAKDTDDLLRKFALWTNKPISPKQQTLLRKYAQELGLETKPRIYHKGISERKGVSREQLKRHYTVHKVKGKTRMVARIPKGQAGAGRFAKRG